jgi:flagellar biosynthesis/type III secretory pathway protein FliH
MGFHKDLSVQPLDIESINDILRKNRDGNFRPRAFEEVNLDGMPAEHIPVGTPADAAMEAAGMGQTIQTRDAEATPDNTAPEEDAAAKEAAARKAGYTEGYAEGYQKGLSEAPAPDPAPAGPCPEAQAQMEEAARLFTELTTSLTDHAADHHSALRAAMEQTLLTLASDLAGQQIDALPTAFAQKVGELVDRVGKTVDCTQIHLNPEDLSAIEPALTGSDLVEGCVLQADEALPRGSVDIRSGPNRVQSALPDFDDGALPVDWDDSDLHIESTPT